MRIDTTKVKSLGIHKIVECGETKLFNVYSDGRTYYTKPESVKVSTEKSKQPSVFTNDILNQY